MKKHKFSKARQRRELWSRNIFAETLDKKTTEEKMKTFHMKHDEEMNYDCSKCNAKISAHNKDWHKHLCNECFDKEYFPEH